MVTTVLEPDAVIVSVFTRDGPITAFVSARMKEYVLACTWRRNPRNYIEGDVRGPDGIVRVIQLHRYVMNAPAGVQVDHIDRDRTNNTDTNLRLSDATLNSRNRNKRKSGQWATQHVGVTYISHKKGNPWNATADHKNLGHFPSEDMAVYARYLYVREHWDVDEDPNILKPEGFDQIHEATKARQSRRLLRTGISRLGEGFQGFRRYKGTKFHKYFPKREDAERFVADADVWINQQKAEAKRRKLEEPITRNSDGIAIRTIRSKSVTMDVLMDDATYEICRFNSICLSSDYPRVTLPRISVTDKSRVILLHHLVMGWTEGFSATRVIDHINGNKLDARRCNLRIVSWALNGHNKRHRCIKNTPYHGVKRKHESAWEASIQKDAILYHLGTYKTPELAAMARDGMARFLYGDDAFTNNVIVSGYRFDSSIRRLIHIEETANDDLGPALSYRDFRSDVDQGISVSD